jgi:hypothetical protein
MINTSTDMALEALLEAAREKAPDLPTELIKAIYQVEKIHQFNLERKASSDALQKLIDEELGNFQRGAQ